MKTAIHQAAELYEAHGLVLANEITEYLKNGYVFCTPYAFMMGCSADWDGEKLTLNNDNSGNAWYIRLAVGDGCVPWFLAQTPYPRKYVCWEREFKTGSSKLKVYEWEKIKHRILK